MVNQFSEKKRKRKKNDGPTDEELAEMDVDAFFASFIDGKDGDEAEAPVSKKSKKKKNSKKSDEGTAEVQKDDESIKTEENGQSVKKKKKKKKKPKEKPEVADELVEKADVSSVDQSMNDLSVEKEDVTEVKSEDNSEEVAMEKTGEEAPADGEQSKPLKKKKKKKKSKENVKDPPASEEEQAETEPSVVVEGENVKEGLSRLEETDSDFFKFLQENDPDLLNFSGEEDSEGEGSGDESADSGSEIHSSGEEEGGRGEAPVEEVEEEEDAVVSEVNSIPVTADLLDRWEGRLKKGSLPSWKQLVRAFQAAVATARGEDTDTTLRYTIVDPDLVNRVITMCLEHSTEVLKTALGENPTASPKWTKVKLSLKSYLTNLTDLLGLLTSDDVLCAVMRHCKTMLPYYAAFSRLIKKFLKAHITVWGSKSDLSRVVAFTCLQALVKKIPTFLGDLLKKLYVEYTKCSKAMNAKTRDNIVLMRNCLVELFKINPSTTYTTGFLYIRQLAVTLRSVVVSKKEVESVYNWQFINCLHVWVAVLGDCDACLQPLIFPLIQVMMGVLKLHSSPCYFPLHLHTMRMMLHLGASTGKHIPLLHPLLGCLNFCSSPNKAPASKPIDLTCVLKVTKGYKKTKAYQDGVFELTYELTLNYVAQLSQSIAFPEASFPVSVWLKKFNKGCTNSKYTNQVKQILEKMEVVARDITDRRSGVSFSPRDLEEARKWEEALPESALTKFFNNWLKVHRTVLAANLQSRADAGEEEEEEEEGEMEEEEEEESSALEDAEKEEVKPVQKKKKKKRLKEENGAVEKKKKEENGVVEKKKKKKLNKKKLKVAAPVAEESGGVADTGDLVEDIVLSD